ncbi:MAG: ABC transporter [Chloroflexi bacterium]|nr:ABC transporter [Chloroflexota bacterium]MDA1146827.1 ABC transporter [Chloroflexota bacterium]MQC82440.1 ABC transporter [Chloroflexota bacterium]
MTLARLEWFRLRRTWRGPVLLVIFLFFGLVGPLTARYIADIFDRFGGSEIQVIVPDPVPADGLIQYLGNVHQIGLLVVIVVAASGLAFDASPDVAAFFRTRVSSIGRLVLTRAAIYVVAASAAFIAGALAAWYETIVLIGSLPIAEMIGGMFLGVGYYAFVIAVVALSSSIARSTLAVSALAFGVTVVDQVLWGLLPPLERWSPARLAFALSDLTEGADLIDYLPTLASTAVLTALLLAVAIRLLERREV